MKLKKFLFSLVGIIALLSCSVDNIREQGKNDNTIYVNTFIGTGGHGHTFPGATMPFGMVQLSPDTRTLGWDACGGYHYSDSSIIGFSHTHLSGTGIGDLGDILFMPFSGETKINPGDADNPDSGFRSRFNHNEEKSLPGYYSVKLLDYNIQAELTATQRAGFHRYNYLSGDAKFIIDLTHFIHQDNNPYHILKKISDTEIAGFKQSSGWAEDQKIYFYARFNQPFEVTFYDNDKAVAATDSVASDKLKAVLTFNENEKELLVKVGISSVDFQGAKNNLDTEINNWDFDEIKAAAHQAWVDQLNKINVKGGTEEDKTIFYTSLYHTCISPNLFSDVDGRYRGMDKKTHQSNGRNIYTVFSLWDTFRAFHPLQLIINPKLNSDFIHSLLTKYEEGGLLPMWELEANYTGTMIGNHAIPVIVDAYMKGIRDFDKEIAYEAIVKSSSYDTTGLVRISENVKKLLIPMGKKYNEELGYIPSDLENESVSKALEYAYNDWCVATMAKELGKLDDFNKYYQRSKNYAGYYDSSTGFMRGKNADGSWRTPFDPRFSKHGHGDYVEGNAFQWTWFVPHDVEGLVKLMGGTNQFIANLDTLFSTSSELVGKEASADISGMIGQYAHGNEPSHHITHMYNFVGQSWKTQELTTEIMKDLYMNAPDGLSGNEDCGQMSAWYILNSMGFYSFCPGAPYYSLSSPVFDKVEINLSNGKTFTIVAANNSPKHRYIESARLNGEKLEKAFFSHEDLITGATIELEMSEKPNINLFD